MPNKSTKGAGGINSKCGVQCETARLSVSALKQLTSTVVFYSPAPLFAPMSEKLITRQQAQIFLDKLASVYLEHARMIVKTPLKTELPEIDS